MGDTSMCLSGPTIPAFHLLQKHLWVLAAACGEALEPCADATLLGRPLKPTAGAGCLLIPGAWEESNSGRGQAVLPQQMVSIWFSQSSHLVNSNTGLCSVRYIKKKQKRGTQCHIKIANSFNVDMSEIRYIKKEREQT